MASATWLRLILKIQIHCQINYAKYRQFVFTRWLQPPDWGSLWGRGWKGVGGSEPVLEYLRNTNTNIEQIQILPDNIWHNSCCDLMAAATWLGLTLRARLRGSEPVLEYFSPREFSPLLLCIPFHFITSGTCALYLHLSQLVEKQAPQTSQNYALSQFTFGPARTVLTTFQGPSLSWSG